MSAADALVHVRAGNAVVVEREAGGTGAGEGASVVDTQFSTVVRVRCTLVDICEIMERERAKSLCKIK